MTIDAPVGVERATLDPAEGRYLYNQERCHDCGGAVRASTLGDRVAHPCETCLLVS